jgi:hypothetical protein
MAALAEPVETVAESTRLNIGEPDLANPQPGLPGRDQLLNGQPYIQRMD